MTVAFSYFEKYQCHFFIDALLHISTAILIVLAVMHSDAFKTFSTSDWKSS